MPDTLTIVADTLRTMMGATAAEPYVRAIEKAVRANDEPPPMKLCDRCQMNPATICLGCHLVAEDRL